jgi:organic hydroperoxide reductase OsmC/OhrA
MGADDTLYTAEVGNEDGTAGHVRIAGTSAADILPTGGPAEGAAGYNPEQFLAMAWSTCLGETLKVVIREAGLEHRSSVRVEVALHRDPVGGYRFVPRALVRIDGADAVRAQELLEVAHARCPVSKLLTGRGEVAVELA